jgi:hypothetical protein
MSQINSDKGGLNIDRYIILLLGGGDSSGDESAQRQ